MKINVTKEHIRKGVQLSPEFCAVALAIKERVFSDFVSVSPYRVSIENDLFNITKYELPSEVTEFITKFDSRGIIYRWFMRPISFELNIYERIYTQKPSSITR